MDGPPRLISHSLSFSDAGAIFNLINTTVGAGILGIPFAYTQLGLFFGILATISCAVLSGYTLYNFILLGKATNKVTIEGVSEILFPNHAKTASRISLSIVFLTCLGTVITYWTLIAEILPNALYQILLFSSSNQDLTDTQLYFTQPFIVQLFCFLFFIYPLSLLREISSLKYTSFATFISILYVVSLMTAAASYVHSEDISSCSTKETSCEEASSSENVSYTPSNSVIHLLLGLPVILFAYTSHQNAFPIYAELKREDPSALRIQKIVVVALIIVSTIYITFGILGSYTFGSSTIPNIFKNFNSVPPIFEKQISSPKAGRSWGDLWGWIIFGRIAVSIVLCCSIPVLLFPSRKTLYQLVYSSFDSPKDNGDNEKLWKNRHYAFSTILCGGSLLISMLIPDSSILFDLLGSGLSSFLAFIIPATFWIAWYHANSEFGYESLSLSPDDIEHSVIVRGVEFVSFYSFLLKGHMTLQRKKMTGIIFFGILFACVGLFSSIYKISTEDLG